MRLFKRKNNQVKESEMAIVPPQSSRVEVEIQKDASAEAHSKAIQANQHLNDLLVENGFTLKIFLAAGGHQPDNSGTKNR